MLDNVLDTVMMGALGLLYVIYGVGIIVLVPIWGPFWVVGACMKKGGF